MLTLNPKGKPHENIPPMGFSHCYTHFLNGLLTLKKLLFFLFLQEKKHEVFISPVSLSKNLVEKRRSVPVYFTLFLTTGFHPFCHIFLPEELDVATMGWWEGTVVKRFSHCVITHVVWNGLDLLWLTESGFGDYLICFAKAKKTTQLASTKDPWWL